ncbi:MAG TPA: Mur ligase family protein [Actinomycetota bacterium]|jgi:dihydrofolate synthase/folylpolyglutamate synthase
MDYRDAVADLDARQPQRMVPDLDRIGELVDLLDHPELTYPTIHVTGTNGKTTTTRLIGALACAHGLSAGVYTSPHLHDVTERLALCDDPISYEEFAEEYERLQPFLREVDGTSDQPVTYFETLTALAFVWFADKPVSVGVFEVGMGGTWDATNVVGSDVAVITPISLDHPELGSTVRDVATEKAGIIKAEKTVVAREQPADALTVIDGRAREMQAQVLLEGRDWELTGRIQGIGAQAITVRGLFGTYEGLRLPLFGEHVARNAAAALVAFEAFVDRRLADEAVEETLAAFTAPGRLEVLARHPLIVVDGAHNPAGAEALARAIREAYTPERLHLVLACSSNKDVGGIVSHLAPLADAGYATRNTSARSAPADVAEAALVAAGVPTTTYPSVHDALAVAQAQAQEGDLILVTGSLYTVADARAAIVDRP